MRPPSALEPDTVAYNSVLKALSRTSPCVLSKSELRKIELSAAPVSLELSKQRREEDQMIQKLHDATADGEEVILIDEECKNSGIGDRSSESSGECSVVIRTVSNISSDVTAASAGDAAAAADAISAAELAEQLLREMEEVNGRQYGANQKWYTDLADDLLDDDQVSAGPPRVLVKANVRSYSTVMDAYARHRTRDAAVKVQDLLEELIERYESTGDGALRPNVITYNTCLTAWARAGCCKECLDFFQNDMPVDPDVVSHNIVLHALAKSGWVDAGARAQVLLDQMKSVDDGVRPNGRTYSTCMDAWSRSGRPDMARALLKESLELYDETGDLDLKPNSVSYATVIHAYALSCDKDKAAIAFRLFQDMRERGIQRNRVVLNNLLNCFATSKPEPTTVELVEKLYRSILEHPPGPDHYTFGTVLKASANLLWKDRDFAPAVFKEACKRGQVSDGVLWKLRQAVPAKTYRELVGGGGSSSNGGADDDRVRVSDLPREWTRNVREQQRQHRAQQQKQQRQSSTSSRQPARIVKPTNDFNRLK